MYTGANLSITYVNESAHFHGHNARYYLWSSCVSSGHLGVFDDDICVSMSYVAVELKYKY